MIAIKKTLLMLILLALQACGGGGGVDDIPTTGLSITQFTGQWTNTNPNPVCGLDIATGIYVSEGQTSISAKAYIESYNYFSDANCSNYLGSSFSNFDVEWSVPTSPQTSPNSIRVRISYPKYSVSGQILPGPIESDPNVAYNVLFVITAGTLNSFFDVTTLNLDDQGYPLGNDSPLFTYTK